MATKKQSSTTNSVVEEKKKSVKKNTAEKTKIAKTNSSKKNNTVVVKKDTEKKNTTKKDSLKSTKSSTSKKNAGTKSSTKKDAIKKSTPKKTTEKKVSKKSTSVKTTKKDTNKKVDPKNEVKDITLVNVFKDEKEIELVNNLVDNDDNNISEQEKIEKDIIEEINNVNTAKIEDSKFSKKKNKNLLAIGIFIVLLGVVALIVALIANRIVDREFLSDSTVTLMMTASIIIEGFGAFIIINES